MIQHRDHAWFETRRGRDGWCLLQLQGFTSFPTAVPRGTGCRKFRKPSQLLQIVECIADGRLDRAEIAKARVSPTVQDAVNVLNVAWEG